MNITIPTKLYNAMPWICFILVILFIPTPASIIKWICIIFLFCYGSYISFMRMFMGNITSP